MKKQANADQLNRQIDALMNEKIGDANEHRPLLVIAADLRLLPNPEFKNRLRAELTEQVSSHDLSGAEFEQVKGAAAFAEILPTLGGKDLRIFPADQRSFAVSFISHTALIALIASGILIGHVPRVKPSEASSHLTYLPAGNGGGGSGDHSPVPVSRGTPPKMSDQQLTPPVIVVHQSKPILPVQPTVVGPPDIKLPQSNQIGDLVSSNVVIPSNGTGVGGGAGNGNGNGLGSGIGVGVGPGYDRGVGGGAFHKTGVVAPRAVYDPEPEYSEEARKLKQQGVVTLALVVDEQGRPRDIRVVRSLGMGLDEKAVEAVKKWKFAPGTKDGIPVAVQLNVEVSFRLY